MNYKALICDMLRQQRYHSISPLELAASGGMSLRSLQRRMRNPETITLGELERFAKKLRMEINYTVK